MAVRQTTVERLLSTASLRLRAADQPEVDEIKGDGRLADVVRRAAFGQVVPPKEDMEIATSWGTIRLETADVAEIVAEILDRDVPFSVGRQAVRTRLHRLISQRLEARRGDAAPDSADLESDLRRNRPFQAALGRLWPTLSAPALVRRLLTSPPGPQPRGCSTATNAGGWAAAAPAGSTTSPGVEPTWS